MNRKRSQMKISLVIILIVLSMAGVFAIYAFPNAAAPNTNLKAQGCNNETNSATSLTFVGICTASRLDLNDGTVQTANVAGNNQFMGINLTSFNSTISNCGIITSVQLCYEWWTSSANIANCAVRVDANGGSNYTNASTTCPGTTANPGQICADVSALESWTCGNFFTSSGTRALASMEVRSTNAGAKSLSMDVLFFNVTYTADLTAPTISFIYPLNTTYIGNVTALNVSVSDNNLESCWFTNNSGLTNLSFACSSGANLTGLNSSSGANTWIVYANDSYANLNSSTLNFNINFPPTIINASAIPNSVGASTAITIYANTTSHGVNDSELSTLSFYCDDSAVPTSDNTECTGGLTTTTYPYNFTCSFTSQSGSGNYSKYCRVYDGTSYSSAVQANYSVNADVLVTSVISVAGDSIASYYDTRITEGRISWFLERVECCADGVLLI